VYRKGHIGVGLVAASPIILIASLINLEELVSIHPDHDLKLQRWTRFLRHDFFENRLNLIYRIGNLFTHRMITHTILYAIVSGLLSSMIIYYVSLSLYESSLYIIISSLLIGFLSGFIGIISHMIGDVFTPSGIQPFLPVDDKEYSLNWFKSESLLYNYLSLVIGIIVIISSLYIIRSLL
jgi:membrane-bound metal-dependent hydrolase YbcI (DUF457 family)